MSQTSNRIILVLHTFLLLLSATAQQQLTLRDAILKAGTELAPERLKGLQWIKDTHDFCHVKGEQLIRGSAGSAQDQLIVDLATLNDQLPEEGKLKGFPPIEWETSDRFRFAHSGKIWVYEVKQAQLRNRMSLPDDAVNEDIHGTTFHVAHTIDDDLYIALHSPERMVRVTSDGGNGIVNGKSVHREEYGVHKGTFWDPAGEKLAFYRMDESMVTEYSLEDITTRPSTFRNIRYPMAGQPSHHVTIGIYDLATEHTVFLKTGGPADQYLTNIAWDPSGRSIHVVHLDRATENLRLVRYDASSGEAVTTLLEEHDDKYLEPQHPMEFLPGRNAGRYIWRSSRDGWPHLYLHDINKGLVRQLTKGNWVVKDLLVIDPRGEFILVSGTAPIEASAPLGATETQIYRVDLGSGRSTRLTGDAGLHFASASSDGRFILDTWNSMSVPGRVMVRDGRDGRLVRTLLDPRDPLADLPVGTVELLSIPGEQGDLLNARLIKPHAFDPQQRYPVLIYVYNGPHLQLVTSARLGGAPVWMMEAAERGYLVWTLDGHGSDNRGRDFEQVIHRRLGEVEVKDQMHGVSYLKSLPFVDSTRLAVHGWSFGGYVTTALLAGHPGVFRVGVAGGPVMDWSMYEVMYTERYMDTPAENPDGYTSTALPALAEKLQEDLLIITGGQDDVVLRQHGLTFIKNCVDKGVQVDFFEYPGHAHNVRGKDRLHLMEKVLNYIDQRIQPYR